MAAGWEDLQGDRESAAPSYRRPAQSGRSRAARWLAQRRRVILLLVLALGGLSVAGWGVTRFLQNDPRFYLSSVELQGERFAARSQVEDQFVSDRGRSLLRVPLEERRRAIEQIPWIRTAAVTRVFPGRIAVRIEERVPVAFLWTDDGIALLDEAGVILDVPTVALLSQGTAAQAAFAFPVVRGVAADEPPAERRAKMRLFLALMNDLDRGDRRLRDEISEVDLSDPQDARAVVADPSGAVLLHLGAENFLSRYLLYVSRIGEWKRKFANIQSVDLRFEGQVVINADRPEAPSRAASASAGSAPASRPAAGPSLRPTTP